MNSKLFALFCAVLLLFTGCVSEPKDDFADYEFVEPPAIEGVTARTEFSEYGGNVEKIHVVVNNDRDDMFSWGEDFCCLPRKKLTSKIQKISRRISKFGG